MNRIANATLISALILVLGCTGLVWKHLGVARSEHERATRLVAAIKAEILDLSSEADRQARSRKAVEALKDELHRLRTEAAHLRSVSNELNLLQADNVRLNREIQFLQATLPTEKFSAELRDQWGFAGYSTPEAAFLSGLWALREGRTDVFRAAATDIQAQARFATGSEDEVAAGMRNEAKSINAVRLIEKQQVSPSEVILKVYFAGLGADGAGMLESIQMKRDGAEWKFDGNVTTRGPENLNELVQTYRKYPELLRPPFARSPEEVRKRRAVHGRE